jgi:dimeric dUTPase (all-alpha-NTP-PPase superfamily)
MFRIDFDHKTCRFVVQVLTWGILWKTCEKVAFETYADARHWVNSIGLNRVFIDQNLIELYR